MALRLHSVSRIEPASNGACSALHDRIELIFSSLPRGRGWSDFPFNTLTLGSWFQPILCANTGTCFGYEGLLLANNLGGRQIGAETVFALSANNDEQLFLDWLCRALHLRNFANFRFPDPHR